jgi:hypothetical protein
VVARHGQQLNVGRSAWQLPRQFIATVLALRWDSRCRITHATSMPGFDNGDLVGLT